jgi:hypothetical protein
MENRSLLSAEDRAALELQDAQCERKDGVAIVCWGCKPEILAPHISGPHVDVFELRRGSKSHSRLGYVCSNRPTILILGLEDLEDSLAFFEAEVQQVVEKPTLPRVLVVLTQEGVNPLESDIAKESLSRILNAGTAITGFTINFGEDRQDLDDEDGMSFLALLRSATEPLLREQGHFPVLT